MLTRNQKGDIGINYIFLLALGLLILMVLIGLNFFIGDKIRELIMSVKMPDL